MEGLPGDPAPPGGPERHSGLIRTPGNGSRRSSAVHFRTSPVVAERRSEPSRFDPVRRVEMVAVIEDVEREVREDAGEARGDPGKVVRIAAAAQGEIDRPA